LTRIPYQVVPLKKPIAGLSGVAQTWYPTIKVAIIFEHATSKRFEAVVDSGSALCLFHADIGKAIGLRLKTGEQGSLGGVVGGSTGEVYYHRVKLKVLCDIIPIMAGFSEQLSVAAILGRHGFFENFTVTFDPCYNPPGLILERVGRA